MLLYYSNKRGKGAIGFVATLGGLALCMSVNAKKPCETMSKRYPRPQISEKKEIKTLTGRDKKNNDYICMSKI